MGLRLSLAAEVDEFGVKFRRCHQCGRGSEYTRVQGISETRVHLDPGYAPRRRAHLSLDKLWYTRNPGVTWTRVYPRPCLPGSRAYLGVVHPRVAGIPGTV